MGEIRDKTRNAAQDVKGKAKEAAGKATGNRKLESKGLDKHPCAIGS